MNAKISINDDHTRLRVSMGDVGHLPFLLLQNSIIVRFVVSQAKYSSVAHLLMKSIAALTYFPVATSSAVTLISVSPNVIDA